MRTSFGDEGDNPLNSINYCVRAGGEIAPPLFSPEPARILPTLKASEDVLVMNTDTAKVIPTTVRLDPVLRRQLKDAARLSFRPLSREIAFRLAESLKQRERALRATHP